MFKLLMALFIIFNLVAIAIILLTIICTYIGNIRKSNYVKSEIVLPSFYDCRKTFIQSCVASSIFALVAWILYSPQAISETSNGVQHLATYMYIFGVIWSVILLLSIISELIFEFMKNKSMSLKSSLLPLFIRCIWCFILAFVIV